MNTFQPPTAALLMATALLAACSQSPSSTPAPRAVHSTTPAIEAQFKAAISDLIPRESRDELPPLETPIDVLAATLTELAQLTPIAYPQGSLGHIGGPVRRSRRDLTFVVVSPIVVDANGAIVNGSIEVVDDTDPAEATFLLYQFGDDAYVTARSGAGEATVIPWSALTLRSALMART